MQSRRCGMVMTATRLEVLGGQARVVATRPASPLADLRRQMWDVLEMRDWKAKSQCSSYPLTCLAIHTSLWSARKRGPAMRVPISLLQHSWCGRHFSRSCVCLVAVARGGRCADTRMQHHALVNLEPPLSSRRKTRKVRRRPNARLHLQRDRK